MKKSKGKKEFILFNSKDNTNNIKNKSLSYYNFKKSQETPIKIFPHVEFPFSAFFTNPKDDDNFIMTLILSFLSYKDYLRLQNVSKKFYNILKNKRIRKKYILHSQISIDEQLIFYESNINIKKLKNILIKELMDYKISSNIYKNILSLAKQAEEKDSKYKSVLQEIKRDINRTFYTEKFTKGNGKLILINVLSCLAFIRPEIGYCQGMNFIAGALIELIEEEEKIFWIFLSFIDNIDMNLLYLKNMPDYSIRVFQLNYYIKLYFPNLFNHFKRNQITPDIIFSKWILTIFANYLPFETCYKIWDLFILDKWKAIFRISIILLDTMKDKLIQFDLNQFCLFIKSKEIKESVKYEYICQKYNDYNITNKKLKELKEEFFIYSVKEKLEDKEQDWDLDQLEFVNQYHKELSLHKNQVKQEMDEVKKEIEKINKKCGNKSDKYLKQVEIIKNYKLQLETKIEVRDGYEKVLKRNKFHNSNSIDNKDNKNIKNINIGININLNNDEDNNKVNNKVGNYKQKNNNINIINNNNNIYVNNINIIQPFNYQLDSMNREQKKEHKLKNMNNRKELSNDNIINQRKSFSLKKGGKFKIFGKTTNNELDKIQIKINNLNKEIDSINNALIKHYKLIDKEKQSFERNNFKKDNLTKKLEEMISISEVYQTKLIKNLSEKLKLSEKFVNTNKY